MPKHATQLNAKTRTASPLLSALLAISLSTGLSACGPSPTGQAGPSATPTSGPSPAASPRVPARALAAMTLSLKADTALAGFNTAQQAPFALCLSQIATAEHRIFLASELPAASRSALEAAGILVTRAGGVTSLRLSKALSLRELLAGVEISLPDLPVGELEGRSIFKSASGVELGFVSWNASLAEGGSRLGILLTPSAETRADEACPRLQVSLTGGRLKLTGGQISPAPGPIPSPAQSPSPVQSPTASQSASPAGTPIMPSGLQVVEASATALTLHWDFSGEPVSYRLYLDGAPVAENHTTPDYYRFTGLSADTAHRLGVQAVSPAGVAGPIASLEARTLARGSSASGNFSSGGNSGGGTHHAAEPVETTTIFVPGSEFQANTFSTQRQISAQVGIARDGSFVAVWAGDTDPALDEDGVIGQRFDSAGEKIGSEFLVNSYTTGTQGTPSIAMNADGDFVVTWNSSGQDGSGTGIYGQRFNRRGARVGSEFPVNTYISGNQSVSDVALSDDGDFIVVWQSGGQDGSGLGNYGQRFDHEGDKIGSEFSINSYISADQFSPEVAISGNGEFVVVWTSDGQDGSYYGVYAQPFDRRGTAIGTEIAVATLTARYQGSPDVAIDGQGRFMIAWDNEYASDGSQDIFARRFTADGEAAGDQFLVNSYTSSSQANPALQIDAEGRYLIVWESTQDGDRSGVYGQRYSSDGTPLGSEFQLNIYTSGYQSSPQLAMNTEGDFVAVWEDRSRDLSNQGVFGLKFTQTEVEDVVAFADVTPIFASRCSGCHGERFATYSTVRSLSETIRRRVYVDRDMPDVPSDEADAITEAERKLIADWVDQGMQP